MPTESPLNPQRFTLRNLATKPKLLGSFLLICAFLVFAGGIGLWSMGQMNQQGSMVTQQSLPKILDLATIRYNFALMERDFRQGVIEHTDPQGFGDQVNHVAQDAQIVTTTLAHYQTFALNGQESANLSAFQQAFQSVLDDMHGIDNDLQHQAITSQDALVARLDIVRSHADQAASRLTQLMQAAEQQANANQNSASQTYQRSIWLLSGTVIVAILLAILFAWYIARQIATPLQHLVTFSRRVAEGDLAPVDHLVAQFGGRDEPGQLTISLQHMVANLRQLVGQIASMSSAVAGTSAQISVASEQTGNAVEQVAQTIQQVAGGAQTQSAQLGMMTQQIEAVSRDGQTLKADSAQTTQAMATLKESVAHSATQIQQLGDRSVAIGQIIQTIDEIAAQTNLLALNAAIEAARAGDHGRGFAVVADEVRKLAERSAQATSEIGAIIHEMQTQTQQAVQAMQVGVTQVDAGVDQAVRAKEKAEVMVQNMEQMMQTLLTIAQVGQENSAAAEEVSAAAEEMSAQVEETIASTQELNSLAQQLDMAVSTFHLGDDHESTPATARDSLTRMHPRPLPSQKRAA
jgi:methyl-accepting chemotaxis protein